MRTFTDATGRQWAVIVNGATVKRVATLLGVDLGNPHKGDPPPAKRLYDDIVFLVDLLYVVCKPQADQATPPIGEADFAAILDGSVLASALAALETEWADFFRRLGREAAARLIEKQAELVKKALDVMQERISGPLLDRLADEALQKALATVGPVESATTTAPATTPSPAGEP